MVLNTVLEGKDYLVGDKCTYADLSFIPWSAILARLPEEFKIDSKKEFPNYDAWLERITSRPAVKKIHADKDKAMSV